MRLDKNNYVALDINIICALGLKAASEIISGRNILGGKSYFLTMETAAGHIDYFYITGHNVYYASVL